MMCSRSAAYHIVPRQGKTTTAHKKMRMAPNLQV
jgi:hypothetical protein